MRFGDGAWRMLDDVTPHALRRVDETEVSERRTLLHVSSQQDLSRGATLSGHMFTVTVTSPLDNVIRVRVTHHRGRKQRGPRYELNAQPQPLAVTDDGSTLVVTTGHLQLTIDPARWSLRFSDTDTGQVVTESPHEALGLMVKDGSGPFMREQLTLGVGEQVYGLGERFSAFTKNGQSIDMWQADCGTCSDKAYKNIPFFMTSRGYGVLVNSSARVSFEIGTEQVNRTQFSVPGEDLDYFLILGPSPKQVLSRLGALSGRPALPPAWSFGLWLTTSFTTQYNEETVNGFLDGMQQRNIPLHVFHFDCFWMKPHHWCNFSWDETVFPDPVGMLRRMHDRGLRVCLWINPYIAERSHLFEQAAAAGFLLKDKSGDVWQRDRWQAGMACVDFTNPDARRWYQGELSKLVKMGVDCFKADFGEEIPTDVEWFDGSDPERMHNHYSYLYNEAVFDLLQRERGPGQACLFSRSATATCQQFPVHWGGDCYGTYESMAESLRGGLSLSLCGFCFWSHDIGGFESDASAAVYKRWVAFGLLSSHSRLHGSTSYRVPWSYDEEACDVLRHFTQLKCRLMPYLMACAVDARDNTQPVMRPMLLEFPDDPTCRSLDRQYMLGGSLLVAPVFHDARVEYYLPAGTWTHLLSGEVRSGGRWLADAQTFFELPVWIRQNSIVFVGRNSARVDYDLSANIRLLCGKLEGRQVSTHALFSAEGQRVGEFEVYHDNRRVTVSSSDLTDFQIHLPWATRLIEVDRGSDVQSDLRPPLTGAGVIVRSSGGTASFRYDD